MEAAVSELKRKMPDATIPSADTVFNYIYKNDIEDILSFFRRVNSEILALIGIPDEAVDVAVDFHDIGYYGDKNDKEVRGIKPKNGTSWGHSFFTIDLLWKLKLTLDIVNITALSKDYAILLEGVVNRVREMGVKIGTMFLDREFFNLASILTLFSLDVDFIMAAKTNKRIKKMLEEHKRKNGVTPAIFKYRFEDKRSPEFYLVAIPNPDYDTKGDKKKSEFLLFATSINFGSVEEFVKRVPEEYKRRWNIETGYRVKNEFKIRTCSKKGVARALFFVVQSILHNFLNVQKSILSIAAYELKSLITEDIQKYLRKGKFLNTISLSVFYAKMAGYNEHRLVELRCQLAAT
jgi:IS4 transposase